MKCKIQLKYYAILLWVFGVGFHFHVRVPIFNDNDFIFIWGVFIFVDNGFHFHIGVSIFEGMEGKDSIFMLGYPFSMTCSLTTIPFSLYVYNMLFLELIYVEKYTLKHKICVNMLLQSEYHYPFHYQAIFIINNIEYKGIYFTKIRYSLHP